MKTVVFKSVPIEGGESVWLACFRKDFSADYGWPLAVGGGRTKSEALGDLVRGYPSEFGVEIEDSQ